MTVIQQILDIILWPPLFYLIIFPGLIFTLLFIMFIIWAERKIAARVQLRYGPLEIAPKIGGAIQLMADFLRLAVQEVIIPKTVDLLPYMLGPLGAFVIALLPVVVIPFSPSFYPVNLESSIIIAAALTTIPPLLVILAAWASNNKFSIIGGARESFLIATYEVIILLSIASMVLLYSTYNFIEAVSLQQRYLWGVILNPLAALVFFVAVMMGTSRFPFEIAEAESEIVMGPVTEYSGIMYGLGMGISYTRMFVYNLIFVLLFLGGWSPLGGIVTGINFVDVILLPAISVIIKTTIVSLLMVFTRSVYARLRVDQAITAGWGFWFVLAMISLIVSAGVSYLIW